MDENGKAKGILEEGQETEDFLAFLDDQVTNHPVVKQHHEKWKELIDWCDNGNQYSWWDDKEAQRIDVRTKMNRRKRFVVVNLMKPLSEVLDSKLNMNHFIDGYPNSSEVKDVEGAKVATKLLAHNSYINDEEELWEQFKYDLTRTGNAWFCWLWDKNFPTKVRSEDGETKDGKGEVIGYVPSVFNMRWDTAAKDIEHAKWVMELDEITDDEILETFDITEEELSSIDAEGKAGDKYAGMNERKEDRDDKIKTRILRKYYERSTKKHPNGRHILAIPGKILWKGKNPALGELPYWHEYFKRSGNSFIGSGPLHHVQGLQRSYNRMCSIIMEHIESWRPKMTITPGSVREGAFTVDAFELLEVANTGEKPQVVQMPSLDPQTMAYRDYLASAFNTVSNVHEVSYSQLPQYSSRAPASLFSMMLEQENIKIDPLIKRLNKMIVSMAKRRLRLMDKYYDQSRLVKVVGAGQESSIGYFKGADLSGNFDVKLSIGVSLHQSKIVQQRLLMELKTNGVITDNNKLLKLLNMGDITQELRGDIADEERAIRENQQFLNDSWSKTREKGGVFVYQHDDHQVHMEYHTNLAKTEEATTWPNEKWLAFDKHIAEHYQYWLTAQQAISAAPSAGAPAPSGASTGATAPAAETMAEGAAMEPEVAQEREATSTFA